MAAHARASGRATTLVRQLLRGHYAYYGLPSNFRALSAFHQEVRRIWFRCLTAAQPEGPDLSWDRFKAMLERFPLPLPRITHPWRRRRHDSGHLREEPSAGKPHARICEGESRMAELLDHNLAAASSRRNGRDLS